MLIFVDSRHALEHVLDKYPGARIVSDNPLLAHAATCRGRVEDISALLDQPEAKRLGEAGVDLLLELESNLLKWGACKASAGVARQINITLALRSVVCTLLQRGFVSARAVENETGPVMLAVRDEPRWDPANPFLFPRFAAPQRQLAQYGFFGDRTLTTELVNGPVPEQINETVAESFLARLASAPVSHLLFHAASRLGLVGRLPRKTMAYGKRCEMLDETLGWLALRGHRMARSVPPGYARRAAPAYGVALEQDDLAQKMLAFLEVHIGQLDVFSKRQADAISRVILDHLVAGLSVLPETGKALVKWADEMAAGGTVAFLTSGIYGPIGVMAHDALSKRNIPVIDFEHGVTTGIAATSDRRLDVAEVTTCDVLLACSDRSAGRFARGRHNKAHRIEVVGNADQARTLAWGGLQRGLARSRLNLRKNQRAILHVSTLIYGGNGRPGDDAPAEATAFAMDKALIEDVYPQVAGRVIFKPYPTDRFPDSEPYGSVFRVSRNICFASAEDFRYIRAAADVIVTQANSSTIGWCVALDVPLIHLQSRTMHTLSGDDLYEAFNEAFFVIDADCAGWEDALVKTLSIDRDVMMKAWRAKRPARQSLLRDALSGPSGSTGHRAASVILSELGL